MNRGINLLFLTMILNIIHSSEFMVTNKIFLVLYLCLFSYQYSHTQGTNLPLGNEEYHTLDRLEILTPIEPLFHSSIKYYTRGEVVKYVVEIDSTNVDKTNLDKNDIKRVFINNNEWLVSSVLPTVVGGERAYSLKKIYTDSSKIFYTYVTSSQLNASMADERYILSQKRLFGIFYHTPANFFEVNQNYYYLRVNPLINFQIAKEINNGGDSDWLFINQRGIELRGGVDDRIFFYTNILDTQSKFSDYVIDYVDEKDAIPGNGLYKTYKSSIIDVDNAYDYLNGQGYVGLNISKHVGMQLGHGRNFIGNGYRSLLLSDFSHNYFHLKLNWQLGRLRFQNLFAELSATSSNSFKKNILLPKKYMATHYLSYQYGRNFSIGFFETSIFNRDSETGQFELQYLNPVILYRTVEHLLDSPDNLLLGFDLKINFLRHFQLYNQFLVDEFNLQKITGERNGWWGNKYGIQTGLKYINVAGLDHLDFQLEFNIIRPYTYTHNDSLGSSYSHYNQALAHPLGANFREWLIIVRYTPLKKWSIKGRIIRSYIGEDYNSKNWGSNILISNKTHEREYGNKIGQGVDAHLSLLSLDISFEAWQNIYFDLQYFYRKKDSKLIQRSTEDSYIGSGLRMNINRINFDF